MTIGPLKSGEPLTLPSPRPAGRGRHLALPVFQGANPVRVAGSQLLLLPAGRGEGGRRPDEGFFHRLLLFAFLMSLAPSLLAQTVTSTARGVVVAHDGVVELFDRAGKQVWSANGVRNATSAAAGAGRVVVLDALANEAVIVNVTSGAATRTRTAETPVAAAFAGGEIYVLARDAGLLQHIGGRDVKVRGAMLAESSERLYVYSRVNGTLEEIANDRVVRTAMLAPFASAFVVDGRNAYLTYPRDGHIRMFDVANWRTSGEVAVGAVPVDVAFAGGGTALTARILAVADPSSKKIWLTETTQSTASAIARGFLRGFLGLGLFGGRSSEFPTGIDRVFIRGSLWLAYDSSTGTLYRFTRKTSSVIIKGVSSHAFALTDDGVAVWTGGRVRVFP